MWETAALDTEMGHGRAGQIRSVGDRADRGRAAEHGMDNKSRAARVRDLLAGGLDHLRETVEWISTQIDNAEGGRRTARVLCQSGPEQGGRSLEREDGRVEGGSPRFHVWLEPHTPEGAR